jgi:hypothetical protein
VSEHELEREQRDTIPAASWDGAPPWALAMRSEMGELRDALQECSRLVTKHTRELQQLNLAQLTLEHRQNQVQDAAEKLAVVVPLPLAGGSHG